MIYKKFIISASFLIKNVEDDFQFLQKDRGSRIATQILEKNNTVVLFILLESRLIIKQKQSIQCNTVRTYKQIKGTEYRSGTDPTLGQLLFNKCSKTIQQEKRSLSTNDARTGWPYGKNKIKLQLHTIKQKFI